MSQSHSRMARHSAHNAAWQSAFLRRAATDAASALPLTLVVYVASGSLLAVLVLGAALLALRPVTRTFALKFRSRRDKRDAAGA
jgi:hypothetical protein